MLIRAGVCLPTIYHAMSFYHTPGQVAFLSGALTDFLPASISLVSTNTPRRLTGRFVGVVQTASQAGNMAGPVIGGLLAAYFGVICYYLNITGHFLCGNVRVNKPTSMREDLRIAKKTPFLLSSLLLELLGKMLSVSVVPMLTPYLKGLEVKF